MGATGAFTSGTMEDDYTVQQTPGFERFQGNMPDEGGPGYASPSVAPYAYGYAGQQPARPTIRHHMTQHNASKTNKMI